MSTPTIAPAPAPSFDLDLLWAEAVVRHVGLHEWETKTLLRHVLARGRPHHVLEVGSDHGGSLHLWHGVSTGEVVSVDLPGGPWGSRPPPDRQATVERWVRDYPGRVTAIEGDSHDPRVKAAVLGLTDVPRYDLLFLDGDHSYKGVLQDFADYSPLVRPGGLVVFHDVNPSAHHRQEGCQVPSVWLTNFLENRRRVTISEGKETGGFGVLEV